MLNETSSVRTPHPSRFVEANPAKLFRSLFQSNPRPVIAALSENVVACCHKVQFTSSLVFCGERKYLFFPKSTGPWSPNRLSSYIPGVLSSPADWILLSKIFSFCICLKGSVPVAVFLHPFVCDFSLARLVFDVDSQKNTLCQVVL